MSEINLFDEVIGSNKRTFTMFTNSKLPLRKHELDFLNDLIIDEYRKSNDFLNGVLFRILSKIVDEYNLTVEQTKQLVEHNQTIKKKVITETVLNPNLIDDIDELDYVMNINEIHLDDCA